ncbi:MAG: AI-2E family transporter, partial [Brevundimonas sp.]
MKTPITVPTSTVARNALVAIAVVGVGAAIYWMADILTPLAMAIFLLIMIDGVKRFIEDRTNLPRHLAGTAALLVVVLGFFASIAFIVNGAYGFFSDASGVSANLGPRIDQILGDVSRLVGVTTPPTTTDLIAQIDVRGYLMTIAGQAQGIVTGAIFVMIYLGFLLA